MDEKVEIAETVTSNLARDIADKYNIAKSARMDVEEVWKKALQNFNGEYGEDITFSDGDSKVFVNITQMKTMAAYSRIMATMLSPSGFPFSLKNTPIPELVKKGKSFESAMASKDIAPEQKEILALAKGAADGMRNQVKDDLIETMWEEKFARGVLDMVIFGQGVFKGPMAAPPKKRWGMKSATLMDKISSLIGMNSGKKYELIPVGENRPELEWVSSFEFYPDPSAYSASDMMWAIHRHVFNTQQLVELAEGDFDGEEIQLVLNENPEGNWSAETWESSVDILNRRNAAASMGKRYVVLEFWGYLTGRDLRKAGKSISDKELNKVYLANIWSCGNHCIKVNISNRASGKIPFYVVPYEKVPYKIWGRGVPEKMADPQAVINASARAMIGNMGLCSGPQVVVDMSRIVDGVKVDQIVPWGIWPIKNMEGVSNPPVQFVTIPSMLSELKVIQDIFRNFVQEVTSTPDMASGMTGRGEPGRTLGGMSMLFGAADSYTRGVIANIDNDLTKPLIRALYDWEMQYNPDETIKGDFTIEAGGVSGLMAKELTSQRMAELIAATGQVPGGQDYINFTEVLKEIFRSMDVTSDTVVYSDEQVKQNREDASKAEVEKQRALAQATNVPKPKAETTKNDALLSMLTDTEAGEAIRPILFAKVMDGYGELDESSRAALAIMQQKVVDENRAYATAQELALLEKDIALTKQLKDLDGDGVPDVPEDDVEEAPPAPVPQAIPAPTPNINITMPPKRGKFKFTNGEDGSVVAEPLED